MKAPTQSERQRRIAEAVTDPEWQTFREALEGMDTESKLNNLREYYEDNERVWDPDRYPMDDWPYVRIELENVRIRVDNYLEALVRGGQLPEGVSLEQALTWDWNLRILK